MGVDPTMRDGSQLREDAILRGRVSIVYALSSHFLFLPFAALCVTASAIHQTTALWFVCLPIVLLILVAVGAIRLKAAYDAHAPGDDPKIWGRWFALYSALTGSVWGLGATVWFVPGSFPMQAYLVLAFLGVTATEFIVRGAYRPPGSPRRRLRPADCGSCAFLRGHPVYLLRLCRTPSRRKHPAALRQFAPHRGPQPRKTIGRTRARFCAVE
jgi:hypothetical protein